MKDPARHPQTMIQVQSKTGKTVEVRQYSHRDNWVSAEEAVVQYRYEILIDLAIMETGLNEEETIEALAKLLAKAI